MPKLDSRLPSEPIDPPSPDDYGPEAALQRMGLIRKYCSEPLPGFRTFEADGCLCAELVSPGLGNAAAIDFFVGQLVRGFTTSPLGKHDEARSFFTGITRPVSLFSRDLLIRRDAWDGLPPVVECFAGQTGGGFVFRFRREYPVLQSLVRIIFKQ